LKELIEEIYSRCKCPNDCLKDWIDCERPEPFIGNLHPRFAIIGTNPSSYENKQPHFTNVADYMDYYENKFLPSFSDKEWPGKYLRAFKMLANSPNASLIDFNRDAIILNIVKCSTKIEWHELPEWAKEEAKKNCINYLVRQLEKMQPRVILAHGKPACIAIMDMLRDETRFRNVSTHSGKLIKTLAEEIRRRDSMDGISEESIQAENENGRRILFLFNKHLSRWKPTFKTDMLYQ
jgi:hypothetical protein